MTKEISMKVEIGHVYEEPSGRRRVVTGVYRFNTSLWCLNDNVHAGYDLQRLQGEGWKLVGCVLSDGRLMCVGETWEYRHRRGTVEHRLKAVSEHSVLGMSFDTQRGSAILCFRTMRNVRLSCWHKIGTTPTVGARAPGVTSVLSPVAEPVPPPGPTHRCPKCRAAAVTINEKVFNEANPCGVCAERSQVGDLIPLAPAAAPVSEREKRRREIDAVLAEDARLHPAFAEARKAAVMALAEACLNIDAAPVGVLLKDLHWYEDNHRIGNTDEMVRRFTAYSAEAWRPAILAYERARGHESVSLGRAQARRLVASESGGVAKGVR